MTDRTNAAATPSTERASSRRSFLGLAATVSAAATLSACTSVPRIARPRFNVQPSLPGPVAPGAEPGESAISPLSQPGSIQPNYFQPIATEPFTIPPVPQGVVPQQYWRQLVPNTTGAPAGTIVVDPAQRYLYLNRSATESIRYGIGVGRAGFGWSGQAIVGLKRAWPNWTPPDEMIARDPSLARYSAENGGQAPGLSNPLGARALYLFQDGVDTLYRIHGNPEAASIGRAVSSGCIRMLNHDIIDIYERVPTGTPVIVRGGGVA